MDHAGHVASQRDNTHCRAHVQACLQTLVDHSAHQRYQNTLCLIALDQLYRFFLGRSRAQDNRHARDISGYQRHAQLTDRRVHQMAAAGLFVRSFVVDIFQDFDELCAECRSHAAHERVVQSFFPGHQGLYYAQGLFQFSQVGHLRSGHCVVAGKAVGGVRESYGLVCAVLRNCVVDGSLGQAIDCVVTAEYSVK